MECDKNYLCSSSLWCSVMLITMVATSSLIGLYTKGNIEQFNALRKYYHATPYICLGGVNITNYTITPEQYNTTLTYSPAYLHARTAYLDNNNTWQPATLIYPTFFETGFNCYTDACRKSVAAVSIKYMELRAVDTFACYIDYITITNDINNTSSSTTTTTSTVIIGLAGEISILNEQYKTAISAIVLSILYTLAILALILYATLKRRRPTTRLRLTEQITNDPSTEETIELLPPPYTNDDMHAANMHNANMHNANMHNAKTQMIILPVPPNLAVESDTESVITTIINADTASSSPETSNDSPTP